MGITFSKSGAGKRIAILYGFIPGALFGVLVAQYVNNFSAMPELYEAISSRTSEQETEAGFNNVTFMSEGNSSFDIMVGTAYHHMLTRLPVAAQEKRVFELSKWKDRSSGGLGDLDRILLGRIYGEADSVMEYGLGESTFIANYVGVQRYAGIDSDPQWIAMARKKVSDHFRFYLADIGPTHAWGFPDKRLPKQMLNYQLAPLILEPLPFDVYMVDGRFRIASVLASFLHASARGGDPSRTKVMLHDCGKTQAETPKGKNQKGLRRNYHAGDNLLDIVEHSGRTLCVFMRKANTTDNQLLDLWQKLKSDINR